MVLAGRHSIDLHPQIIPGRLAGNGVGISITVVPIRWEKLRDQMVEQECFPELGGSRIKVPGASTLADCIPGPHRIPVDPVHQLSRDANPTLTTRQPDPVVLRKAK